MKKNSTLVFSTDKGRIKSAPPVSAAPPRDSIIRLKRESKGRGGKTVTVLTDAPLPPEELKSLAADLKKLCGTGGTVKDGVIEIQGEHRDKIKPFLEARGFKVKIAGG